jgi:hypothetical protein
MVTEEERAQALSARCSVSAWNYLQSVRSHPQFANLLNVLDASKGMLLEFDIEQAFRSVQIQHPLRKHRN